ncbi:MAG: hypothetical protein U0R17_00980 [Acidimicrobiia bacterium]
MGNTKQEKVKPLKSKVVDLANEELKENKKIEKKINKEYSRFRYQLEDIRQAYLYVEDAESTDDIYSRLKLLEKTIKRVRKGSIFTRGLKNHRRLLRNKIKN